MGRRGRERRRGGRRGVRKDCKAELLKIGNEMFGGRFRVHKKYRFDL